MAWLTEEVGELAQAIRKGTRDQQVHELGDVIAWVTSIANQLGISLDEALDMLERDSDFLLRGDVFTEDVVATWLTCKREKEIEPMRLRPHPYEFCLYFDA